MFAIHDVFEPTLPLPRIRGPVRLIEMVGSEEVILIAIGEKANSGPFAVSYLEWLENLRSGALTKITDPYLKFSSIARNLPEGAAERYKSVLEVTEVIAQDPSILHTPKSLAKAIAVLAQSKRMNRRTIKRWIFAWLRFGRNPVAVVRAFLEKDPDQPVKPQTIGKKRGIENSVPELSSEVPSPEVMDKIKRAWETYVVGRHEKWSDAYHDMLIDLYRIPEEAFSPAERGYFLDPNLIAKYRAPTWPQTRYRFRQFKRIASKQDSELPQGQRGKATDGVHGPGYFEIDATFFQIQLVSRLTKGKLVGRPTVYLIVDIFSDAIVGYAVSLENPSWASAALALYNCFSDKADVFKRLDLPYDARDWPCHELPNMLRADRAELVSNMGQEFPASGIRVETPPPMNGPAKGTVEGKHSEIKRPQPGRFDLDGRYEKVRKRRDPDGKKNAALDIFEFEQILVEIILDINREPVEARRIPPDALAEGAKVASRIGFYQWGLTHRPGFTHKMGPNFVYDHLLTKAKAIMKPDGIRVNGEVFNCDRLHELGYRVAAIAGAFQLPVVYNPMLASEVFFYDAKRKSWATAVNVDPEVEHLKLSFSEVDNYRGWQNTLARQAAFNAHGKRRERLPFVRKTIRDAAKEKKNTPFKTSAAKANIIENRAQERADDRTVGLNGARPMPSASSSKPSVVDAPNSTAKPNKTDKLKNLWSNIDGTNMA